MEEGKYSKNNRIVGNAAGFLGDSLWFLRGSSKGGVCDFGFEVDLFKLT